ncbi:structural maintenance of chromosomes protein 2-like [Centruroides vittatus]|uniref:structural maintenance of chromosomes protein 2-like n=1 Tax=Centruroides vittatus TaxID=120091 RepID=UPI00350ED0F3
MQNSNLSDESKRSLKFPKITDDFEFVTNCNETEDWQTLQKFNEIPSNSLTETDVNIFPKEMYQKKMLDITMVYGHKNKLLKSEKVWIYGEYSKGCFKNIDSLSENNLINNGLSFPLTSNDNPKSTILEMMNKIRGMQFSSELLYFKKWLNLKILEHKKGKKEYNILLQQIKQLSNEKKYLKNIINGLIEKYDSLQRETIKYVTNEYLSKLKTNKNHLIKEVKTLYSRHEDLIMQILSLKKNIEETCKRYDKEDRVLNDVIKDSKNENISLKECIDELKKKANCSKIVLEDKLHLSFKKVKELGICFQKMKTILTVICGWTSEIYFEIENRNNLKIDKNNIDNERSIQILDNSINVLYEKTEEMLNFFIVLKEDFEDVLRNFNNRKRKIRKESKSSEWKITMKDITGSLNKNKKRVLMANKEINDLKSWINSEMKMERNITHSNLRRDIWDKKIDRLFDIIAETKEIMANILRTKRKPKQKSYERSSFEEIIHENERLQISQCFVKSDATTEQVYTLSGRNTFSESSHSSGKFQNTRKSLNISMFQNQYIGHKSSQDRVYANFDEKVTMKSMKK